MIRQAVKSSNIKSVGYEDNILEVEFKSGQIYRGKIPPEKFDELMGSESIGSYFYTNIKGKFPMTRIV